MKFFAIVDFLDKDPISSQDVFLSLKEAETELIERDDSCDLVEIEVKKRDDLLLIRQSVELEFKPSFRKIRRLEYVCACVDRVHNNRNLCEACNEWAGGPPEGE